MVATLFASLVATGIGTATTLGFSALTSTFVASNLAMAALGLLTNIGLGLALSALTPKPSIGTTGYNVTQSGTALNHQIVYGRSRTGGVRLFDTTTGDENVSLHRVLGFTAHEIDAFEDVYIGGRKVTKWREVKSNTSDITDITGVNNPVDDEKGYCPQEVAEIDADGNIVSGTESGIYNAGDKIVFRFYDGRSSGNASAQLATDVLEWTADHQLLGIAYMYVKFKFDRNAFPNGVPEITTTIRGKKVYDPRDTNTVWTDNPSLIIRDYLLDDEYGIGEVSARVDDTSFTTAANICDELALDGVNKRYTFNGNFTTGLAPYDFLSQAITTMAGLVWYSQGEWRVKAAKYVAPTVSFDEDDLRSGISLNTRQSRRDNFNKVTGTFRGEESNWQVTDYPEVRNVTDATDIVSGSPYTITSLSDGVGASTDFTAIGAASNTVGLTFVATGAGTGTGTADAFLGADNGQESSIDFNLPFTDNSVEARRLARIFLERNRQQLTFSASFGVKAFKVQVGDIIKFDYYERFGWVDKEFEVTNWTFGIVGEYDIQVSMVLREISEPVFDEIDDGVIYERDNTNLLSPFDVPDVTVVASTTVSVINGVPRRYINLNASTTGDVNRIEFIEFYYKKSTDTDYILLGRGGFDSFPVYGLAPNIYDFKAVAVNTFFVEGEGVTDTNYVFIGPLFAQFGNIYNGGFETGDGQGWTLRDEDDTADIERFQLNVVSKDASSPLVPVATCPYEGMLKLEFGVEGGTSTALYNSNDIGLPSLPYDNKSFSYATWDDLVPVTPGSDLSYSFYTCEAAITGTWPAAGELTTFTYLRYYDAEQNKLFETATTDAVDTDNGVEYKIAVVGSTDFTAIGASSNTVGEVFVATGAGTGTGTAYREASEVNYTDRFTSVIKDVWERVKGNATVPDGAYYTKVSFAIAGKFSKSVNYVTGFSLYQANTLELMEKDAFSEFASTSKSLHTLTSDGAVETVVEVTIDPPIAYEGSANQSYKLQVMGLGNVQFSGATTFVARLFLDGTQVSAAGVSDDGGFCISAIVDRNYDGSPTLVELKAEAAAVANVSFTEAQVFGVVLKR